MTHLLAAGRHHARDHTAKGHSYHADSFSLLPTATTLVCLLLSIRKSDSCWWNSQWWMHSVISLMTFVWPLRRMRGFSQTPEEMTRRCGVVQWQVLLCPCPTQTHACKGSMPWNDCKFAAPLPTRRILKVTTFAPVLVAASELRPGDSSYKITTCTRTNLFWNGGLVVREIRFILRSIVWMDPFAHKHMNLALPWRHH